MRSVQTEFIDKLNMTRPFVRSRHDKRPVVVSLFSGAGGLDMGFHIEGYNIVWANDFDKDACETYRANIGDHIRCGDIEKLLPELEHFREKVDVLIGGPPCQGFSVAGKMNPDDPRSQNVWRYLKALEVVRPHAFLMENVKALGALTKWEDIRNRLLDGMTALGYSVNYVVVNASDYDVPQNRERVLFIGFREKKVGKPDLEAMLKPYRKKAATVREVLANLDPPGTGNNAHECKARITLCQNPVMRRSPYAGMLFNGAGRPIRLNGYCATLPASMGGNKTPFLDEDELLHGAKSFVEEYHRGLQDGTIKAEFKPAPSRLRRLTVEEAAALQTFPPDYKFVGSRTTMYRQIGNAVPCNLSRQVAKMIKEKILGKAGKG